ncbi:Gfo/Idh/MocA family oxidoreductase [Brevibacillus nitrificans]|uniref:Gfo/Idh/MocA family protein n=1 Tax=Brevibacillus nitrificans TaxID=651560 RepID=UPI002863475C|nr:Gfo/Idh/MocA family oxidoreductase [Brevibacillus nitrificans]MDR7316678.1 putative dehydrogenase [Brevibacillus nitrificans]
MSKKKVRFGVIGCGLMGKEFASAVSRWCHLLDTEAEPQIVAVCDANLVAAEWFTSHFPSIRLVTKDYRQLLSLVEIDAIYCAVPHHLHAELYTAIIQAGKHLLGEKPFGIDRVANERVMEAISKRPDVVVRCSSELPFFPGGLKVYDFVRKGNVGKVIEVEAGFLHSSDLNPQKPINWKRQIAANGEYGCMGDLGMHVLHLPLRLGWRPRNVRAILSNLVTQRPGANGSLVPCETWDNATLLCEVKAGSHVFPMSLSMKRIAPGHNNTWFIRVIGMEGSVEFSTKNPKELRTMLYRPGGEQAWRTEDLPYASAYPTITGPIFEFGFSDAILQMWAAFCDEVVNGSNMRQPFTCATPQEAAFTHQLFSAALESHRKGVIVNLE